MAAFASRSFNFPAQYGGASSGGQVEVYEYTQNPATVNPVLPGAITTDAVGIAHTILQNQMWHSCWDVNCQAKEQTWINTSNYVIPKTTVNQILMVVSKLYRPNCPLPDNWMLASGSVGNVSARISIHSLLNSAFAQVCMFHDGTTNSNYWPQNPTERQLIPTFEVQNAHRFNNANGSAIQISYKSNLDGAYFQPTNGIGLLLDLNNADMWYVNGTSSHVPILISDYLAGVGTTDQKDSILCTPKDWSYTHLWSRNGQDLGLGFVHDSYNVEYDQRKETVKLFLCTDFLNSFNTMNSLPYAGQIYQSRLNGTDALFYLVQLYQGYASRMRAYSYSTYASSQTSYRDAFLPVGGIITRLLTGLGQQVAIKAGYAMLPSNYTSITTGLKQANMAIAIIEDTLPVSNGLTFTNDSVDPNDIFM